MNISIRHFFIFASSAIFSWIILKILIPRLHIDLLDEPNERSAHSKPTPRGGGIVFVLVGSLLAPFNGWNNLVLVPFICLPLALLGLIDDRNDQPISLRFAVQFMTATSLIMFSSTRLLWWQVPFIILTIIALINFVNFMDGVDGLVATSSILILAFALIKDAKTDPVGLIQSNMLSLLPLIGGLVGFLLMNWSPAKVFMGDVGSTFLGAVLSGIVLQENTWFDRLGLILVGFPLFGDALFCLLRRIIIGHQIFKPHCLHLFQRLHQAGWSHQRVAITYSIATILLGIGWLFGGTTIVIFIAIWILCLGIWLDNHIAIPFTTSKDAHLS